MLTEEIKTMSQTDLIRLHQQFSADAVESQLELRDSYDHLLLSLRRLIESHGPTQEYQEWASSTSSNESSRSTSLGC